jgi:hypothetical protein
MMRIVVELPRNRDCCGSLFVFQATGEILCGPFAVGARANDQLASARGNPTRNPLHRFGDTPSGTWRVREILPSGPETNFPEGEFGPHGVVVLEATGGDAALADANGRFRILIQAGQPSADGRLRATAGALRLSNEAQLQLLKAIEERGGSRCDVVVNDAVAFDETVAADGTCDLEDPPLSTTTDAPAGPVLDVTRRDALRVGAGGAVALNLAVSFVALSATSSPAHSEYVEVAYNSPPENQSWGTLGLYNQTSSNVSFESSVSLCVNSANVIRNGACTSTQQEGTYEVTATRFDNGKKATRKVTVPPGAEGSWSVTDGDF